jgi:hypothetical protein
MKQPDTALVVMAKKPEAGITKTRLCPPFSYEQAASFYEAMLMDTFALADSIAGVQLGVAITPIQSIQYFIENTPNGTRIYPVDGRDIGQCLHKTIVSLLKDGFKKVLAINSDGPTLPENYLYQSIMLLDDHDAVLGPGEDGGYYLIGLKEERCEIFDSIDWSTERVLSQTLARLQSLQLNTALLPPWYDVDTTSDAARLAMEIDELPLDRLIHTRRFLGSYPHLRKQSR